MYNIETYYKTQYSFINVFDEYYAIVSQSKLQATHGEGLKILTPKQMLQRLLKALVQVKAGIPSENVLNKINQNIARTKLLKIIWLLNEFNKVIKQNGYYIDTIFMNFENSNLWKSNLLGYYSIFQLKENQREVINMLLYQIWTNNVHGKI